MRRFLLIRSRVAVTPSRGVVYSSYSGSIINIVVFDRLFACTFHMAIFRQRIEIESFLPAQEAWRKLLPVVKTNLPICAACGQTLPEAGAVRFCSECGQPALSRPQTGVQGLFASGGFEFEGDVSPQGFNISRLISYRNSCIPVIRGRFEPSANGTRIVIEMNMHPLGYVFLVGGAMISFVVTSVLASDQVSPLAPAAAFGIPCLIFTVCWIVFAAEARAAGAALRRLWPTN